MEKEVSKFAKVWIHGFTLDHEPTPVIVNNFTGISTTSSGIDNTYNFISFNGDNILTVPTGNVILYTVNDYTKEKGENNE